MPTSLHNPLVVPITSNIDINKEISIQRDEPIPVEVSNNQSIEISTITPRTINVTIDDTVKQYPVSLATTININGDYDWYEGIYTVIPSTEAAITLTTKYKVMRENVQISKIPYYETSNLSGGYTVYIGNEVETNGN